MFAVSAWDEGNIGSYIPLTGLQFLAGVDQIDIQQTVELHHCKYGSYSCSFKLKILTVINLAVFIQLL